MVAGATGHRPVPDGRRRRRRRHAADARARRRAARARRRARRRRRDEGRPRRPARAPPRRPSCCRAPRSSRARRAPARASPTSRPRSTASPRRCPAARRAAASPCSTSTASFTIKRRRDGRHRDAVVGRDRPRRRARRCCRPGARSRVRGVQVHDEAVERADAGQRVAVNLVGVDVDEVARGDVARRRRARADLRHRRRARRCATPSTAGASTSTTARARRPARLAELGGRFWQLRLEQPLLARAGDRVVVRSIAPPDTLGGGVVLDPARDEARPVAATRSPASTRLGARSRPPPRRASGAATPTEDLRRRRRSRRRLAGAALALEERLRAAGHEPPTEAELGRRRRAPRRRCATPGGPCASGGPVRRTPRRSRRSRERVEAIVAARRARSRSRGCATSCRRRGSSPRRCLEHLDARARHAPAPGRLARAPKRALGLPPAGLSFSWPVGRRQGIKPKKTCCKSSPRCKRCPVVLKRLRAGLAERREALTGRRRKKQLKAARAR